MRKTLVSVLFVSLLQCGVFASKRDSLETLLKTSREDTSKAILLLRLSEDIRFTDPPAAMDYGKRAVNLAERLGADNEKDKSPAYKRVAALTLINYGNLLKERSDFEGALASYKKVARIAAEIKNDLFLAKSIINQGITYSSKGDFLRAIPLLFEGMKIADKLQDKGLVVVALINIAQAYKVQKNYDLSLSYYDQALRIVDEKGDKLKYIGIMNNKGLVYQETGRYAEAIEAFEKTAKISDEMHDIINKTKAVSNIAVVYYSQKKYDKALESFFNALSIFEANGFKSDAANTINAIASIYVEKGNLEKGITYLMKALSMAKEQGDMDLLQAVYDNLSQTFERKKDFREAYRYHILYTQVKDSLFNLENTKNVSKLQTEYETDKKNKEIQLLNKDKQIQSSQLRWQKSLNYGVIMGLLLFAALAFFIYRGYREKRNANRTLEVKNRKLEQAYHIIELNRDEIVQKNKDITDSINYARRIQQAILPPVEMVYKTLGDSFIVYKPKDVVSGDFYVFSQKGSKVILAAVDCTGHGVPGAFMSMIGNDLLNQIIVEKNITRPSEILDNLHLGVKQALKQDREGSETRDGMDVALCVANMKDHTIEYAGANRPLWIVRKTAAPVIEEIKPDKYPIAGLQTGEERIFTNHSLLFNPGDTFYIFTDGYSDQFGGEDGKKFMSKRFKEQLLSIQHLPMREQGRKIEEKFESWRGDLEQVDDVLVLGFRL